MKNKVNENAKQAKIRAARAEHSSGNFFEVSLKKNIKETEKKEEILNEKILKKKPRL